MTFPKITTTHLVLAAFLAGLLAVPVLTTLIVDLYDIYYVADQVSSGYMVPPIAEPVPTPFPDYGHVSGAGGSLADTSASFGVGTTGSSSAGSGGAIQTPTMGG